MTGDREILDVVRIPHGAQERGMTTKAAFSPEEWTTVLEGPPTAGLIVITAAHGGTFRETIAMSKAYTEARAQHGESELLDEIVSAKPKMDHTRYHSPAGAQGSRARAPSGRHGAARKQGDRRGTR